MSSIVLPGIYSTNSALFTNSFFPYFAGLLLTACLVPHDLYLAAEGDAGVGALGGSGSGGGGQGGAAGQSGEGQSGAGQGGTQNSGTARVRLAVFDSQEFAQDRCYKDPSGQYQSLLNQVVTGGLKVNDGSGYVEVAAGTVNLATADYGTSCQVSLRDAGARELADGTTWTVMLGSKNPVTNVEGALNVLEDRTLDPVGSVALRTVSSAQGLFPFDIWTYLGWAETPSVSTELTTLFFGYSKCARGMHRVTWAG